MSYDFNILFVSGCTITALGHGKQIKISTVEFDQSNLDAIKQAVENGNCICGKQTICARQLTISKKDIAWMETNPFQKYRVVLDVLISNAGSNIVDSPLIELGSVIFDLAGSSSRSEDGQEIVTFQSVPTRLYPDCGGYKVLLDR